ncbi:MAG: hypothetical protein LBJ72_10645 [Dysgonamonadaceae bacterium]|jgi:hypothetical protein|nr:hypothetical protein [Dysgonamonadaceae bacterium]
MKKLKLSGKLLIGLVVIILGLLFVQAIISSHAIEEKKEKKEYLELPVRK